MLDSPGWPRWIEEALACRPEPEGATNIPGAEAPARSDPAPVRLLSRVSPGLEVVPTGFLPFG